MESRIVIERTWLSHNGRRINYSYRGAGRPAKFFTGRPTFYAEYGVDLTEVPESVLVIPLVANLAPIAWFAGVPLDVPTLDEGFLAALRDVKAVFMRDYPSVVDTRSPVRVTQPAAHVGTDAGRAMLFSGGVDTYATYFRHHREELDLITVRGADIPIGDSKQWQALTTAIASEDVLAGRPKREVEANLREFYTYQVDLLIPTRTWWGTVQHGLALSSLAAPLSVIFGYSLVYIAATHTEAIQIKWGSSPDIDNRIAWAGCRVRHDGYELTRMDKLDSIVSEANATGSHVNLRVCYSERNQGLNCSNCEKCLRTVLGLSLLGEDPNRYGFTVDEDTYRKIATTLSSGFATPGVKHLWGQLHERMVATPRADVHLVGEPTEYDELQEILEEHLRRGYQQKTRSTVKMIIIERFPRIFSLYLKMRRRFS